MRLRRGFVTTLLATLVLVGLTTSAAADDTIAPSILDRLINPKPRDPVIGLLPPLPVEETAAGVIMRGWREKVWRNAEQLALAKTPTARHIAQQTIEHYASTQARLIRKGFPSGQERTAERDAWCAVHGTGA